METKKPPRPGRWFIAREFVAVAASQRGSVVRYLFERSLVDTPPPGPGMGMRIEERWRSKGLDMFVARARVRRAAQESTQVFMGVKRASVRVSLFSAHTVRP